MLFESVDAQGAAGPSLVNTHRLKGYRKLQQNHELIALADLLHYAPKENDSADQVAARYAQAWAVMHYLWNKQPARVAAYLTTMEQMEKVDWDKLFATYFGEDLSALEADVKAHVDAMP